MTDPKPEREPDSASWQQAQAWADAQAIAQGDDAVGNWERIAQAAQSARERIREREPADH